MDRLTSTALQAGQPWPLGAHFDGKGVNFAIFSAHARTLELCLFDSTGSHELERLRLPGHSGDIWHGYLPGAQPGLIYGLRAHGPWRPERGHRFDASKLLLDPYARDIVGDFIDGSTANTSSLRSSLTFSFSSTRPLASSTPFRSVMICSMALRLSGSSALVGFATTSV